MKSNIIKYSIGLFTVLSLRIAPHPPNVEPIMATMMPYAKRWGWIAGMTFTALSMLCFDLITGTLGPWSLVTIPMYTLLGLCAGVYFRKRKSTPLNYVGFAVAGTLVYDFFTGIFITSIMFKAPLWAVIYGQIPFTLWHLGGNILFAGTISPLLYKWVVDNPDLETQSVIDKAKSIFS